jgi:hypothetical protein
MNLKTIIAILLVGAIPECAQAQSPSVPRVTKDDAQKVVTIISGDKPRLKPIAIYRISVSRWNEPTRRETSN